MTNGESLPEERTAVTTGPRWQNPVYIAAAAMLIGGVLGILTSPGANALAFVFAVIGGVSTGILEAMHRV